MAKSLFEEANYQAIRRRIENLTVNNVQQWGKMDIAQMLAHCCVPLEQAMGKVPFVDESNLFSKTVIKWVVLRMIKNGSMNRNSPTAKSFVVADPRVFDKEKQRLLATIKDFYDKGLTSEIGRHPGFGMMTNEQWGGLVHLHLDHHLKQFSA
jgi:Protein of unknown function (DUF1569)